MVKLNHLIITLAMGIRAVAQLQELCKIAPQGAEIQQNVPLDGAKITDVCPAGLENQQESGPHPKCFPRDLING